MLIYRFKINSEEHDGFLREIEIQPNQTFLDFHHIMLESAELLHCEKAAFFTTDKNFRKNREVSLKPEKRPVRKYDEDLDQVVTESVALPLMSAEKLKNYIEDPHQRMIYEFLGREPFAFRIELYKILPADGSVSYPRCTKRVGELPKKAEPQTVTPAPAAPKQATPKPVLPKLDLLAKLDDIVENEEELASIENELDDLIAETEVVAVEETSSASESETGMEDFMYHEEDSEDEAEPLDHLDDYEDIENLDKRLSGFDRDADDY